jgi:uncharacterized protein (AIM24 family)
MGAMNTTLDYTIGGDDFQYIQVSLAQGHAVRAEPGAFVWMEPGIEMDTSTGGGLMSGLKRMIGGESFFITTFTNRRAQTATVAFAAPYPGKLVPLELARGPVMCQRDAYLCSTADAQISVAFTTRFGAGLFGGEGLFYAMLRGPGRIWLQTLPFARLAHRMTSAYGRGREQGNLLGGLGLGD